MTARQLFMSYSRKDKTFAHTLASDLRASGMEVWVDLESIPTGTRWDNQIEQGIDACDDLLVILSENSARSDVVLDEVNYALETQKRVLPILLGECKVPMRLRRLESLRLGTDYQSLLERLLVEIQNTSTSDVLADPTYRAAGQRYIPAIAVLPFEVLGGQEADLVLSDGLLTEVVNAISTNQDLFIISSATTRGYRDSTLSSAEIASELRVNYLVSGQLTTIGNQLRLSCELSDAKSHGVVWSQSFQRDVADVFSVQDEIAAAIAHQLQRGVGGQERKRLVSKPPSSLTAWEMVVQALYYGWSEQWMKDSIQMLRRAVELDPLLAEGHALLAARLAYMVWFGDFAAVAESLSCAERALSLAPDNANVLVCSSVALNSNGQSDQALALVQRAVEINPNLADGWAYYGLYLAVRRENKEALEMLDYALELSPKDPVRYLWYSHKVICYANEGDYEQALVACKESTRLHDQWFWSLMAQAQAEAMLGQQEAARQSWSRAQVLNPAVSMASFPIWLAASSLDSTQQQQVIQALTDAGCS